MRILLLTQVVPYPPDSGPKIKTYSVLRYLAQRHDVHLVSFARSQREAASAQGLAPYCRSIVLVPLHRSHATDAWYLARSLVNGRPFLVERDNRAVMRRTISEVVNRERPDAVHADQLTMAQFAVGLPVPLKVLDEHNAVWTIVRRSADRLPWPIGQLAAIEWRKLRTYEGMSCRNFDRVLVVSDADRVALEVATGRPFTSTTVPIAVDSQALRFVPRGPEARHVLSLATMYYPPNVEATIWFAQRAFPTVRRSVPGTRFLIVGSRPPPSVRRLADADSGVSVTGYVADLDPMLARACVLVVPVQAGSGMRVKVLEAFARGIPVVSTTLGVEGIDATPGIHLLVADEADAFAQAVARVLSEPATAERLAAAGRRLVESRYDLRTALVGLDVVYPMRVPCTGIAV